MPSSRSSSFSTTRRLARLRGMIAIWSAVQAQVLERVAAHDHERLGHVAVAGVLLVDPVADVGALERAPLHAS